jgi:uncharacterized membrane protein
MPLLSTLARCAAVGVGTGIRSTTPLALLSYSASQGDVRVPSFPPFAYLQKLPVAATVSAMAVCEAVADATLPLPSRTLPQVLLARMAFGAALGDVLCADEGEPIALGAGVGALSAAWGSFAATGGRRLLTDSQVPDLAASLLEEAQALLLGAAALRRVGSAVG